MRDQQLKRDGYGASIDTSIFIWLANITDPEMRNTATMRLEIANAKTAPAWGRRGRQTSWGGFSPELGWGVRGAKNDLDLLALISSGA